MKIVPYVNRIDFNFRYARNKTGAPIINLKLLEKYYNRANPDNGIMIVDDNGGYDTKEFLRVFMGRDKLSLADVRVILANVFINNQHLIESYLQDEYFYATVEIFQDHFRVIFMERREYLL